MKKNLSMLLTTALIICTSVLLTAAQSEKGLRWQDGFKSPMMGFVKDKTEPLRIQISDFFAVEGNKEELQVQMFASNPGDIPLLSFTFYCEEEFKQPTAKGVTRQTHRLSLDKTGYFKFQVKRDSALTFWLGRVDYSDGDVWINKLKR